ncbi:MAG: PrgI family protein [Candidatus Paceibacteria bacterium]
MRFQVPQFIEVEDKIFGPLTVTQFVYLAGGVGFFVALAILIPLWAAVILGGPVALLGAGLAFYKVNDRPFIEVLQAALEYRMRNRLYIWDKARTAKPGPVEQKSAKEKEDPAKYVPAATASRLKDLAWSLDIKESIYSDRNQK